MGQLQFWFYLVCLQQACYWPKRLFNRCQYFQLNQTLKFLFQPISHSYRYRPRWMYTWWNIWSQFHMYSVTWNTPYFIKYIICSCQNFFWIVTDNIICHRIYTFHNTQPHTFSLTNNIWHISVDDFTLQDVILTFVVHLQFCDAQWCNFLSTKRCEDILTGQQLSDIS